MGARDDSEGFAAFFKRYTRTWQHAVSTAALTAFGTMTFVDRLFAVLAVLAYVLPPVWLYLTGSMARAGAPSDEAASGDGERIGDGEAPGDDAVIGEESAGQGDEWGTAVDREQTGTTGDDPAWTTATVPTDEALLDVAVAGDAAYAVGAAGTMLADGGDGWVAILTDGPGAAGNALAGVAAVAGGAVWVAGDSGAVGRVDPSSGHHVDHSAPGGDTTNLVGVAAAGGDGHETVLLVDGSGRVRRGRYQGDEVLWDDPVTPGSGSSFAGVNLRSAEWGAACDTSQDVYATEDAGRGFRRIGLADASGTLTDVATADDGTCAVSDDDGVIHRYDGRGWTPVRLGDEGIAGLGLAGDRGLAAGTGGTVYESAPGSAGWERVLTPATEGLSGVALSATRGVAVGPDGTVVERVIDATAD